MNLIRDLSNFKKLHQKKTETQKKKERIMKNVVELYEKHYSAYKNDYDTDNELTEAKKKEFDYRQFELGDKKDEESKLTALPKWLSSKNDLHEAIKLIEDIRANTNQVLAMKKFFMIWMSR